MWRQTSLNWAIVATLVIATGAPGSAAAAPGKGIDANVSTSSPAFLDDFDGPEGTPPDSARWTYDLGGGGWGNNELQTYTSSPANARLNGNGQLVIEARNDGGSYTSARLTTRDRFAFTNGRAQATIQFPSGPGLLSAFWALGTNIGTAGWPSCGEIDISEVLEPTDVTHNAIHGPTASGKPWVLSTTATRPTSLADGPHTYWVQRQTGEVAIGIDDQQTGRFRATDLPKSKRWVFDQPFYLILNIAVGGNWPGSPTSQTLFPAVMIVDQVYVVGQ